MASNVPAHLRKFEIPNLVTISGGNGGLPKVEIKTEWSTAEVYLFGAHATRFQKNGESPLLFLSESSQFVPGKAIRGGVPIVFPWFGPRAGASQHGFARVTNWELRETAEMPDGSVSLCFDLPEEVTRSNDVNARVSYRVTVHETLTLELTVTNSSADAPLSFEDCLHTYFTVGNIDAVTIAGLKGVSYFDRLDHLARKVETDEAIRIASEVDRTYVDTTAAVEIHDASLRRVIRVDKSGSASTVVWNPWVEKSRAMSDFGDEEYRQMVCVESGNVTQNRITLAPGRSSVLKVVLGSKPL